MLFLKMLATVTCFCLKVVNNYTVWSHLCLQCHRYSKCLCVCVCHARLRCACVCLRWTPELSPDWPISLRASCGRSQSLSVHAGEFSETAPVYDTCGATGMSRRQ